MPHQVKAYIYESWMSVVTTLHSMQFMCQRHGITGMTQTMYTAFSAMMMAASMCCGCQRKICSTVIVQAPVVPELSRQLLQCNLHMYYTVTSLYKT